MGAGQATSYSPMPSRRRTHKLDNPPLAKLMDTSQCKKSKSLFVRNIGGKKTNKVNVNRLFKINESAFTSTPKLIDESEQNGEGMDTLEVVGMDELEAFESLKLDRKKSKIVDPNHASSSSLASDLSVNISSNDSGDSLENECLHQLEIDSGGMPAHLELQRDVSRDDLMSGSEISVDQFPSFEEKSRRKTVEINKAPLKPHID